MALSDTCEHTASGAQVPKDLTMPRAVVELVEEKVFESELERARGTADHGNFASCEKGGGARGRRGTLEGVD